MLTKKIVTEASEPECRCPELEFRWTKLEGGETALQVKNIIQKSDTNLPSTENTFEFLYFVTNQQDILDPTNHPATVPGDYKFETEVNLDECTNIKLSRPTDDADHLCIYVNDHPVCISNLEISLHQNVDSGISPVIAENIPPFISVWRTEQNNETIELPMSQLGSYNFFVEWGDGSENLIKEWDSPDRFHTYEEPSEYVISITGRFSGISFSRNQSSSKITDIVNWGCVDMTCSFKITSMFSNCSNLKISASDSPRINSQTNFHECFYNCTSLDGGVSHWDVGEVRNFNFMFANAQKYVEDLADWNTESAETLCSTFENCTKFNSDVSGWNTSSVTSLNKTFAGATMFDRSLGTWNVERVKDFSQVLHSTHLTSENYSNTLCAWSEQDLNKISTESNKFSAGTSEYSLDAKLSRDIVSELIGVKDGGTSFQYSLKPTRYVTLSRLVTCKNIPEDLYDVNVWSTWSVGDTDYLDSFVVPVCDTDVSLLNLFEQSVETNSNLDKRFLLMEILSNSSKQDFNMNHPWKLRTGMCKLVNGSHPHGKPVPNIRSLCDHTFTETSDNVFKLDLSTYRVTRISEFKPICEPINKNHIHSISLNHSDKKFEKTKRIGFSYKDFKFSYFNDACFSTDSGHDISNKYFSSNSGNFLYRDNKTTKFLIFSCLSSNSENSESDTGVIDCMISYKNQGTWTRPEPAYNLIDNLQESTFKIQMETKILEESIGFYFSDFLQTLVITVQSESDTSLILLTYNEQTHNFKFDQLLSVGKKINKTFKILNDRSLVVCDPMAMILRYDEINMSYLPGLILLKQLPAVESLSRVNIVNNLRSLNCSLNECEDVGVRISSYDGALCELSLQRDIYEYETDKLKFNKLNTITTKKTIQNKEGNCVYSNIFGNTVRTQSDWRILSSGIENKIYYFNTDDFTSSCGSKQETYPVVISSCDTAQLFDFPVGIILKAVWLGNYLVVVELDTTSEFTPTQPVTYYFNNLYIRGLYVDTHSGISLKEAVPQTALRDLLGREDLLEILNRFCKSSILKDNLFGGCIDRLISITNDPTSDELSFMLA